MENIRGRKTRIKTGTIVFLSAGSCPESGKKKFKTSPSTWDLCCWCHGRICAMVGYVYKNALHMLSWPHYLRTLHAPFAFTIHMYLPDHEECSPKAQHTLGNIVAGNTNVWS